MLQRGLLSALIEKSNSPPCRRKRDKDGATAEFREGQGPGPAAKNMCASAGGKKMQGSLRHSAQGKLFASLRMTNRKCE
jgi:hypothetical protein